MTLAKIEGNTDPVSVCEFDVGTNGLVNCVSYPSLMKLQSCTGQFGLVNKKSQPDIWERWLTDAVTLC